MAGSPGFDSNILPDGPLAGTPSRLPRFYLVYVVSFTALIMESGRGGEQNSCRSEHNFSSLNLHMFEAYSRAPYVVNYVHKPGADMRPHWRRQLTPELT